ncbi:MAG: chemotaxis protein CheX [Actinobacteria bacterium]|nr:chemotaxis protein CheX [Actinomycetota bacterium]
MDDKILHSFINAAVNVLGSELGTSVTVGVPVIEDAEYSTRGVTAMVGVTGRLRGMVIFGLLESTALALVSQMMGEPYQKLDGVAQSGIAELGNVIAGSGVTSLAQVGYQCGITPPAVVIGEKNIITMLNLDRLVVPLETPFGTVEMQLVLRENGQH